MNDEKRSTNRILIADDDAISRRMLQSFLVKWGYEVLAVSNGSDALGILDQPDAPTLAVLDWMMPGTEGPGICREIRKNPDRPYTYVLLLTARTQKEDLLKGLEAGADDYFDEALRRAGASRPPARGPAHSRSAATLACSDGRTALSRQPRHADQRL